MPEPTEASELSTFDYVVAIFMLLTGILLAASPHAVWVTGGVVSDGNSIDTDGAGYALIISGLECGVALFAIVALFVRQKVSAIGCLVLGLSLRNASKVVAILGVALTVANDVSNHHGPVYTQAISLAKRHLAKLAQWSAHRSFPFPCCVELAERL